MANQLKLREVFTPGGQPSITYVSRSHLGLEQKVNDALVRGFAINVVTGPTKSGKTVLCNHVLSQAGKSITIEGGQVRSEKDFWEQIVHALDVASQFSRRESGAQTDGVNAGISAFIPGVSINAGANTATSRTSERTITYNVNTQRGALEALLESNTSLLVDDFHYIERDDQKKIIQALKGGVFKGLSVILLAVPHRAFDPMTVKQELEGRFKHIEIPAWDMDDLLLIPERGFRALNVDSSTELNKKICNEGFRNPLLVQEICSEFCIKSGIFFGSSDSQKLNLDAFTSSLNEIAKSKGFPKYSKLKSGPDAKKKRMLRDFKDGRSQDKYSAILTALASLGPQARTSYDDLRSELQSLLVSASMPAKHEVTAALTNMSKIARNEIEGEPPLEWVESEDALVITDPFLLFYMKWASKNLLPEEILI